MEAGQPVDLSDLIWFTHDIGCVLVWLGKYSDATRFLQVASDLGNNNHYGHFMLAVSIWASKKDREKTLHHLKIAQDYYIVEAYNYMDSYYSSFRSTHEFSDIKDDPEFLHIFGK